MSVFVCRLHLSLSRRVLVERKLIRHAAAARFGTCALHVLIPTVSGASDRFGPAML